MLKYNLQFFAKDGPGGEKTELPTAKKLSDARKEGQVAKSKEIGNGLGLLSLFIVLKIWIGTIGTGLIESFALYYSKIPEFTKYVSDGTNLNDMSLVLGNMMLQILIIVLPVFVVGTLVAFFGDYIQVKWRPTTKPLHPKFSKLSPLKGLKRIFSIQSLAELLKSILKILIISYVVYSAIKNDWTKLFLLYDMPLFQAIGLIGQYAIDLGIRISLIYMILAFADFIYTKWKFKTDMKMTKQEVKDEWKNAEGDPVVKGKIRRKMREISMRRMMQALPKADVVITNPTHYAVAIKYEPNEFAAPFVVAKGEDFLAIKIKEVAKENHIEIVENKPLARSLYATVDVGEQVPPELYQAVAEVLAMVYSLQGKVK